MCEETSSPRSFLSLFSLRTPSMICVLVGDVLRGSALRGEGGDGAVGFCRQMDGEVVLVVEANLTV